MSAPKITEQEKQVLRNNAKTEFSKGETFKVLVPRKNITDKINVQMSFDGKCKTYPILFGKAPNENVQDYVLTTDPFVVSTAKSQMNYKPSAHLCQNVFPGVSPAQGGLPTGNLRVNIRKKDCLPRGNNV